MTSTIDHLCSLIKRGRIDLTKRLLAKKKLWTIVGDDQDTERLISAILHHQNSPFPLILLHYFLFVEPIPNICSYHHQQQQSTSCLYQSILFLARGDFNHSLWLDEVVMKQKDEDQLEQILNILKEEKQKTSDQNECRQDFLLRLHCAAKKFLQDNDDGVDSSSFFTSALPVVHERIRLACSTGDVHGVKQIIGDFDEINENKNQVLMWALTAAIDEYSPQPEVIQMLLLNSDDGKNNYFERLVVAFSLENHHRIEESSTESDASSSLFLSHLLELCIRHTDLLSADLICSKRISLFPEAFDQPIMRVRCDNNNNNSNDKNGELLVLEALRQKKPEMVKILLRLSTLHPTDSEKIDESVLDVVAGGNSGDEEKSRPFQSTCPEIDELFWDEEKQSVRTVEDIQGSIIEEWFHVKYYPVIQPRQKLAVAAKNGNVKKVLEILNHDDQGDQQQTKRFRDLAINVNSGIFLDDTRTGENLSAFDLAVKYSHADLVEALLRDKHSCSCAVDLSRPFGGRRDNIDNNRKLLFVWEVAQENNDTEIVEHIRPFLDLSPIQFLVDEEAARMAQQEKTEEEQSSSKKEQQQKQEQQQTQHHHDLVFKLITSEKANMDLQKEKAELSTELLQKQNAIDQQDSLNKGQQSSNRMLEKRLQDLNTVIAGLNKNRLSLEAQLKDKEKQLNSMAVSVELLSKRAKTAEGELEIAQDLTKKTLTAAAAAMDFNDATADDDKSSSSIFENVCAWVKENQGVIAGTSFGVGVGCLVSSLVLIKQKRY